MGDVKKKKDQWDKIFKKNSLVNEDKEKDERDRIDGIRQVGVHVESISKELEKIFKIVKKHNGVQGDCIDIVNKNYSGGSVLGSAFGNVFGRFDWDAFGPEVLKTYKKSAKDMKNFIK